MKFLYKKITILIFVSLLIGCVTNTPVQSTQTDRTSQNSGNMKLYPYKSGILKFKNKNHTLTWDNWGKKRYVTHNNKIIITNNGSEYHIEHNQKIIKKSRDLVLDWLIVADQDLHSYYVDSDAKNAIVNMQKTETVAGLKCNIWLDSVPDPSNRYCLYNNRIILKHEIYNNNRWSVKKEATFAKFNGSIDPILFTKLPQYPIKNMTKYNNDEELHALIKNSPAEYKKALTVANTIKAKYTERENDIRRYLQNHKKTIELYKNHKIGNAIYYPNNTSPSARKVISYIEKYLKELETEIKRGDGVHLEKLATSYPIRYGETQRWKKNLQQSYRQFFNAKLKQLTPQKQATVLNNYFSRVAIMEIPIYR
jgi:hypothetical protein